MDVKFKYQHCDNIFYSILPRYLVHIIINFLNIHLFHTQLLSNSFQLTFANFRGRPGPSLPAETKEFTVEWFSMLGHEIIEQPSYYWLISHES